MNIAYIFKTGEPRDGFKSSLKIDPTSDIKSIIEFYSVGGIEGAKPVIRGHNRDLIFTSDLLLQHLKEKGELDEYLSMCSNSTLSRRLARLNK